MDTKKCTRCKVEHPKTEFYKTSKGYLLSMCKPCKRIYGKSKYLQERHTEEFKKKSIIRVRRYRLKEYGVSERQYLEMQESQKGVCLICQLQKEELCIDHCHTTGAVRGLLCRLCNTGLGHFKDDVNMLLRAVTYLTSTKTVMV